MPYASGEKRKKWVKNWGKENSLISIRRSTKEDLKSLDLAKMGDTYDSLIKKLINFYKTKHAINYPSKSRLKDSISYDKETEKFEEEDEEEDIETKE